MRAMRLEFTDKEGNIVYTGEYALEDGEKVKLDQKAETMLITDVVKQGLFVRSLRVSMYFDILKDESEVINQGKIYNDGCIEFFLEHQKTYGSLREIMVDGYTIRQIDKQQYGTIG